MATRFYLPSTGTPAISPAFGSWDSSPNADRREMVRTRISSAMTLKDGNPDAGTSVSQLIRQYVSSEALAAQTISGTIKGQLRGVQNAGSAVFQHAIRVAKCSADGSSVTEILAIQRSDTVDTVPPAYVGNDGTPENRRFEQGVDDFALDLTATAVSAGDFLIVEIGYWDRTTNVSRNGRHVYGDDSATDLPEDETTTAANNPWVEFSMDITFDGGGGGGTTYSGCDGTGCFHHDPMLDEFEHARRRREAYARRAGHEILRRRAA